MLTCAELYMIVFFLYHSKLRVSINGQILIQVCFSLIGLYATFIISSLIGQEYHKLSSNARRPLCLTFSAILHYFFLVYFSLTVAQSILLYLKLVKVLGTQNLLSYYQFKVGMISWGKSISLVVAMVSWDIPYSLVVGMISWDISYSNCRNDILGYVYLSSCSKDCLIFLRMISWDMPNSIDNLGYVLTSSFRNALQNALFCSCRNSLLKYALFSRCRNDIVGYVLISSCKCSPGIYLFLVVGLIFWGMFSL